LDLISCPSSPDDVKTTLADDDDDNDVDSDDDDDTHRPPYIGHIPLTLDKI